MSLPPAALQPQHSTAERSHFPISMQKPRVNRRSRFRAKWLQSGESDSTLLVSLRMNPRLADHSRPSLSRNPQCWELLKEHLRTGVSNPPENQLPLEN